MNRSVCNIFDTPGYAPSRKPGPGMSHVVEVFHEAYAKSAAGNDEACTDQKSSEFNRWRIVFVSTAGALFVLRAVGMIARLAFGLFWLWLFVRGGVNPLHLSW